MQLFKKRLFVTYIYHICTYRDYSRKIHWAVIPYAWERVVDEGRVHEKLQVPLVEARCTALAGYIGKALETITFSAFWRLHYGTFWTVVTVYHNSERILNFSSTHLHTNLYLGRPNCMRLKSIKRCPICSRIVPDIYIYIGII